MPSRKRTIIERVKPAASHIPRNMESSLSNKASGVSSSAITPASYLHLARVLNLHNSTSRYSP